MPMSPRLLRPRAAGGFDPRTIGTMLAWYDFSDSSTLTIVSDLVSEIRNKSGTAPTLSQGIEANRPSLSTLGGRQAALFDGSNDYLFSSTATQGFGTLFAAVGNTTGSNAERIVANFAQTSPFIESFNIGRNSNSLRLGSAGRWTGTGGVNTSTTINVALSDGNIVAATFSRTTAPVVRVNGSTTSLGSGSISPGNQAHAAIGARLTNAAYTAFWNSTIGEVLYYPVVLTAEQIAAVENYLKAKWSVAF